MKALATILCSALLVAFVALPIMAQDAAGSKDTVYGWELMSTEERQAYRTELRALKTQAERQAFRKAHHRKMQERAAEKGVTLAGPRVRPVGPSSGGRQQPAFVDLDIDGNGYISRKEYRQAHADRIEQRAKEERRLRNAEGGRFDKIDTNGDGQASRKEFAAHQARRRADKTKRP